MAGGLSALSKPNEVEFEANKYLAGGSMDSPDNIFERIQTGNGLLMERVEKPDGLKVQYCVVSPPTEDGETVFLTLQVVAPEEDMKSDWCRELCGAFEQTLTLVYPGKTFVLPDTRPAPAPRLLRLMKRPRRPSPPRPRPNLPPRKPYRALASSLSARTPPKPSWSAARTSTPRRWASMPSPSTKTTPATLR